MIRPSAILVLLAISTQPALLPAQASQAHPPAPTLDTAGMDRSVKPGDNFFALRQRHLARADRDPGRPQHATAPARSLTELTDRRVGRPDPGGREGAGAAAGSDAPQDRRLLRQLHGRDGHRGRGPQAAAAHARLASPRSATGRTSPACSAPRSAPTWTRSTPPTSTPRTCSASGSRRTSTTRRTTRRSCCRAGWACPTAPTTSTRRRAWRRSAPSTRRTSRPCSGWPRSPTPRRKAARDHAARDRHREGARDPRGLGRRHQGQQPLDRAPSSAPRRRGSTGRRSSPPPGSAQPARFVVWQPGAVTGISALAASEPLETWKDYLTFHAIQSRAARAPGGALQRSRFAFFGPVLSGRPAAARPLEARRSTPPTTRSATPSAGSTSSATSPPRRRRGPRRW